MGIQRITAMNDSVCPGMRGVRNQTEAYIYIWVIWDCKVSAGIKWLWKQFFKGTKCLFPKRTEWQSSFYLEKKLEMIKKFWQQQWCGRKIRKNGKCCLLWTTNLKIGERCGTLTQQLLLVWNIQVCGISPYTVALWDGGSRG